MRFDAFSHDIYGINLRAVDHPEVQAISEDIEEQTP